MSMYLKMMFGRWDKEKLEIIAFYYLCRHINAKARDPSMLHSAYQALAVSCLQSINQLIGATREYHVIIHDSS